MFRSILASLVIGAVMASPVLAADPAVGPVAKVNVSVAPQLTTRNKVLSPTDLAMLQDELKKTVEGRLAKKGALQASGGTLDLVIDDLKPTRPTFRQLSERPHLSFESFGLGGMALTGSYRAPDGTVTPISYKWYEHDLYSAKHGWTWSGATQGFNSFARSLKAG